ncbi:LamG domain-containing protein [Mucilaginibacter pallidiroseus]|uniref:LamG domain-containing protein n=1 Tax=Mucilaginibacter pallidiroseus TaxID=2599295 RepID=A0A563UJK5_9SPHI|nr:LamG-like jellyroll fold domain-containing protein [Mucilaginibacter pallidiroseus]TWR31554.1 LamG domain-containing protein [Mucilaginibacter pallidiroseus]
MRKLHIQLMALALIGAGVSSCQKKFDASSYAPPLDIGGYTSAAGVATSNLVAHWSFDNNLIDSVSKNTGTATGTTFNAGVKGAALQGANNAWVLTDPSTAVSGLKSFTLTEWVNTPPPSTGVIGLFSLVNTTQFWGNLEIFIENGSTNDNGKLRIHMFNGTDDKTYSVDGITNLFDKFVNIGVSYDQASGVCKLYVNGSRVNQGTVGGLTGPLNFKNTGKIVFGCVQFMTSPSQTTSHGAEPWASYLTGKLDEIRIYDKALTDLEVSAIVKLEGRGK